MIWKYTVTYENIRIDFLSDLDIERLQVVELHLDYGPECKVTLTGPITSKESTGLPKQTTTFKNFEVVL